MNVWNPFEDVLGWHLKFKQPFRMPGKVLPPRMDRIELRNKLLLEECRETCRALEECNMVEVADGLADVIFVACGTAVECGIPLRDVFALVVASNYSKADEEGNPILREDGKVLKGPNYWAPTEKIRELLYPTKGDESGT
jgi:NTP pyrophosphatase (non-canonical NTP hydrolase)